MNEQKQDRIFLEIWQPESDTYRWLSFDAEDMDFLIEKEVVSNDSLGGAMTDQAAFDKALLEMTERNRAFSYSDLVSAYLRLTTEDIRIKA